MPEAEVSSSASTLDSNVPSQPVGIPPIGDPTNVKAADSNQSKRAARVAALKAALDADSEREANDKILGRTPPEESTEDEGTSDDDGGSEVQAGAAAAEAKADTAKDVKRKQEERAAKLKAEADRKLAGGGDEAVEADGDVTAEAEATEEATDKPEESKSDKDRKAKFAQVLKLEAEARKRDEKVRAREDVLRRNEEDLNRRASELQKRYDQMVAQSERQIKTAEEVLRLARESPLELLERSGAKPEDVQKWIADAADPTQAELRKINARFEELKQREAQAQAAEERRQREANIRAQREQVEAEYLTHFEERDGEDYAFDPARLIYSRSEMVRLGNEIADAAAARGYKFTTRDIAEAVNEEAKSDERYIRLQKRLAATAAEKPVAEKVVAAKPVAVAPKPAAKPTTVLTNRLAQEAGDKKPVAGVRPISLAEKRALRQRQLEARLNSGE